MARRGFSLLELAVAGALLGALLVVCLQLIGAMAAQRRAADQRRLAVVEVGNILERLAARPWDELTSKNVGQEMEEKEKLSPQAASRLPGAELKIEVTQPAKEPDARRIVVSLRWQDAAGVLLPPVRIATWRYCEKNEKKPLAASH